jgi:hypothetical protein
MVKSISEINKKLSELNKKYKESGLTDGKISHKSAMANLKGSDTLKMSDAAKKKISEASKGKPKSKQHIEALKKTKLKFKLSKQQILDAQVGTTTAQEVADKLNIDFHTYKGIAEYHKVYKKQSLAERNQSNGNCILAWEYNGKKGKFIGEFPSQNAARHTLGIKAPLKHVLEGKYKQMGGYTFEYKK